MAHSCAVAPQMPEAAVQRWEGLVREVMVWWVLKVQTGKVTLVKRRWKILEKRP